MERKKQVKKLFQESRERPKWLEPLVVEKRRQV